MITTIVNLILEYRFIKRWSTDPTRGTAMFEFEMDVIRMNEARTEELLSLTQYVSRLGRLEAIFWFLVCITTQL